MDIFSPFLLNYFNNLIDSLSFQSYLKLANLTPVHKKDSRNDKRNYRSVSEFEKLRAIRASVGGVGNVLVWVTCLRGWHASMGSVGGVLAWMACYVGGVGGVLAWVAWVGCLHGWLASVGGVGGVLT